MYKNELTTRSQLQPSTKTRGVRGSVLIAGIVGLLVLAIVLVGSVVLLLQASLTAYYKQRVTFVAKQCAQFAARQNHWYYGRTGADRASIETLTQSLCNRLLTGMGLPEGTSSINEEGDRIICTVKVHGLVLPLSGNVLSTINTTAQASESLDVGQPPGILLLTIPGQNVSIALPSFGKYVPEISSKGLDPHVSDITSGRNWGIPHYSFLYQLAGPSSISESSGP